MEKVRTLKVPSHAYDPSRRMSNLLRSQILLLQTAIAEAIDSKDEMVHCINTLMTLLKELRPQLTHIRQLQDAVFDAVDTEAEAALCIRTYTQLLKELRPQIEPRGHFRPRRRTSKGSARKKTRKPTARSRRRAGARSR